MASADQYQMNQQSELPLNLNHKNVHFIVLLFQMQNAKEREEKSAAAAFVAQKNITGQVFAEDACKDSTGD